MTLSVSLGLCNRSANFSVSPCKPYCSHPSGRGTLSLPDPESPGFRPVLPLLLTRFHSTNRLQRPPRVRRGTDSESHPSGLPCAELPSGTADQMLALKSQFTGDPRFTGRPVRSRRGRNPQRWNVRRPFVPASREDLDDRLPIWSGVCLRFFVFFFYQYCYCWLYQNEAKQAHGALFQSPSDKHAPVSQHRRLTWPRFKGSVQGTCW